MTAKAGFYGRDDKEYQKPLVPNSGEQYFTQVNKTTGEIEVWNEELISDKYVGTLDKDGNFVPNNNWWGGASKEERKFFQSDAGKKKIRELAEDNIIRDLTDPDITDPVQTPEAARKNANEFLDTQKMTTPPDADADTIATDTLNKLNIKENPKTRNTFGDFRYPLTINDAQDVMQFVMLKYSPRELGSGENFGFGERERVGIDGSSRKIGSATLAIQGGISDLNGCDWGEDKMNLAKLEAAKLAINAIDGAEDLGAGVDSLLGRMNNVSDDMKRALKIMYGGKAAGLNSLLKRTDGAILNPNLELLFDKPTLRPFTFTFKMSARSKDEADQIVKIIRFFKQGMAPRRSVGNLFLLAPHTFQVHYLAKGLNEHPYIGKMKECALLSLKTDYTPENNYATLPDGYMVSYQITLEMKELEPVFNDDYESDTEQQFASFREDPVENAKLQEEFNKLPGEIGF